MPNFGDRLKREREKRNISLDEIATATKISKRHLQELEQERFDDLPGGIFNKGFVRAYAKFLGLNEEELVAEYVAADAGAKADVVPPIAMETGKLMASMAIAKEREESVRRPDPLAKLLTSAVAVVVLLGVAGFAYWYNEEQKQSMTARAAEPTAASTHIQAPVQSESTPLVESKPMDSHSSIDPTGARPTEETKSKANKTIFIELHAKADSWLQVTADGQTPVSMIVSANQTKKFSAGKELVMKLGNAEGVEITHNGKPLPAFAPGTKFRTLTFTPEL